MTLIAALTGAFGLLASYLLLRLGVENMTLRYPLALACAYGLFLSLIWLWLRTSARDYGDWPDLSGLPSPGAPHPVHAALRSGGGGDFGGGGAQASFGGPVDPVSAAPSSVPDVGDSLGALGEADELAIPLAAIVLAVGLALASLYVIYIAPAILAEVMVDGALSYALYRYVLGKDPGHWLATAVRRTVVAFGATAVFLVAFGFAMSVVAPGAHSIGEVARGFAAPAPGGK